MIFVAVHEVKETLEIVLELGRQETITWQIKLHEEFTGNLSDIIDVADELKGEFVLVIEGNAHEKRARHSRGRYYCHGGGTH